jgi:hypothetical protein
MSVTYMLGQRLKSETVNESMDRWMDEIMNQCTLPCLPQESDMEVIIKSASTPVEPSLVDSASGARSCSLHLLQ